MAGVSQPRRTRLSGSVDDFAGFGIGGLVHGSGVTPPPGLRLFEPVALAVQLQNVDVMRQPIEQRAGQPLAAEDAGPFLEWQVRRDDGRAAFVTLAEDLEEQLGAGLRERHVAEFVNDEQFDGGELGLEFQETFFVARLDQLMNETGRGEEGDGEATLARGEAKRQTDMRLAGAGRDSDIMPGIRLLRIGSSILFILAAARASPSFARIAFEARTFSSCSSATGPWRIFPAG